MWSSVAPPAGTAEPGLRRPTSASVRRQLEARVRGAEAEREKERQSLEDVLRKCIGEHTCEGTYTGAGALKHSYGRKYQGFATVTYCGVEFVDPDANKTEELGGDFEVMLSNGELHYGSCTRLHVLCALSNLSAGGFVVRVHGQRRAKKLRKFIYGFMKQGKAIRRLNPEENRRMQCTDCDTGEELEPRRT